MKRNLWIMYAIALLQGMVFYGPIATLYRQAHGLTIFQITLIESISLSLLILLEIPWGIIADKIGCRHTIIFCSALYLISKIIFWKADGFAGFLVERIMLSVVESGFSGVDSTILYLSCGQKNSQKVFGVYHSMSMAGLLFAAGVYAMVVQDHYPLAGFLTVISYGGAAFLSLFLTDVRIHSVKKTDTEPFRVTIKKAMKNRSLLLFLIAAALLSETHQTITVFLNQLQYQKCGLSGSSIGLLFVAATLLGLLGFCSSSVTGRLGICSSLLLFCSMAAASCLTLAATRLAFPSAAAILILRFSNTLFQPLLTEIQNRQIRTDNRATALSVNSMLLNSVAIGTNLVFGALADRTLSGAFLFGTGICIISCLIFYHLFAPGWKHA